MQISTLAQTVGTLNLLGDESRLRLCALLRERELSVSDLVRITGLTQSRVSTHLARLREGGFVRDRRAGSSAFYALASSALAPSARAVLEEAFACADPTLEGDRARLAQLDAERLGSFPDAFAGEMDRHYSPGRTWPSLVVGIASLLRLGDVLDVGSGDGAVAAFLAGGCRSLTCVDKNPRMVEAAQGRLADHPHVSAQVGDVHDLPFASASFDDVLMFHTLTYAEDPARAVAECARVLRPGGRLVVLSLDQHDQQSLTSPFGERHAGFAPPRLRELLEGAALDVKDCRVACRETKKPHFRVVLGIAERTNREATRRKPKTHR